MELLFDQRIRLDDSEHRILRELADPDAPAVLSLEELLVYVQRVEAQPHIHDLVAIKQKMVRDLLTDAEALIGHGACVGGKH